MKNMSGIKIILLTIFGLALSETPASNSNTRGYHGNRPGIGHGVQGHRPGIGHGVQGHRPGFGNAGGVNVGFGQGVGLGGGFGHGGGVAVGHGAGVPTGTGFGTVGVSSNSYQPAGTVNAGGIIPVPVAPGFGTGGIVNTGFGTGVVPGVVGVGVGGGYAPNVSPLVSQGAVVSNVAPPATCRYYCRTKKGQAYCCEGAHEAQGPVGVKPGNCPHTRPECPPVRFGPRTCSNDYKCSGSDKCCFDVCLEQHVCKPQSYFLG